MYFPSTKTLKRWREDLLTLPGNLESNNNEVVKAAGPKRVNLESIYKNAPEIAKVLLDNKGSTFKFTTQVVYLGANIDFLIDDTEIHMRCSRSTCIHEN